VNFIPFGCLVRDKVTGFEGVTVYRVEHMNNCIRYAVQPVADKEGQLPNGKVLAGPNLEIISPSKEDPPLTGKTSNAFKLGVKVRDRLTGLTGIAVLRVKQMHTGDRYGVQPWMNGKGEIPDVQEFDEEDLEQIDPPPPAEKKKKEEKPNGPHDPGNAIAR